MLLCVSGAGTSLTYSTEYADVDVAGCRGSGLTGQTRAPPRDFVWGDRFMGTQTNLHSKFIFSSEFGYFILKMLHNCIRVKKKVTEIS